MATKIFIVKTEEMVDGEIYFKVRCHRKLEKAIFGLKNDIENFKNWAKDMRYYEQEDLDDAEMERTDTSYFVKSSCDDYYYQIEIEETDLFE